VQEKVRNVCTKVSNGCTIVGSYCWQKTIILVCMGHSQRMKQYEFLTKDEIEDDHEFPGGIWFREAKNKY